MSPGLLEAPDAAELPLPQGGPRLPWWVRAGDLVGALLLLVALAVLVGGGFRVRLGGVRLAVTSPLMPLLIGLVVLGARHARHRRPHIAHRMGAWVTRLARTEAWRAAWPPFVATRLGLVLLGVLAVHTIGYPPGEPRVRSSDNELLNLPMRWDAGWYYAIARVGYYWDRRDTGQQRIAFFPAYPMTMRVVGRVFGGEATAFVLAGAAVSYAAFLCGLMLLYQLARATLGDPERARAAVILTACYPFAIYYGGLYTESLFLLGVVGAVLESQRGRWARAIPWGLLVGLTRPNGFLLAATLAVMAVAWWRSERRAGVMPAWAWPAAAVLAPVAGVAIFSTYIYALTGNPVEWSAQHAAWGRTFEGTAPIVASAAEVEKVGLGTFLAARPYEVINGTAALAALALIVPVGRRLGLAYAVFVAVNVVPPLLLGGTMSMGRVTSTMFPLFLWLAAAAPRQVTGVAIAFALLQGFAGVLFYTWRPLY